jgi:class 3 adenylate cyclase
MAMIRQYYLSMLSLAVVVLVLAGVSVSVTGHLFHLRDLALGVLLVLVALNLLGAWIIFAPVARYFDGRAALLDVARQRIRRLPLISAGWAFFIVSIHMYSQFFIHHVWYLRDAPNLLEMLIYPVVLIAIFATLMALFIYFLVGDYTARLREEIYRRNGEMIGPGSGRLLYKLTTAFFAVSIVPLLLLSFRMYFFDDFPRFQILETTQIVQINILGGLFLATIAIIFIGRNLTRPVVTLLRSMRRISEGEFRTRTPVVSDDEVGRLSVGFNAMAAVLEDQTFIRETFGKFVPESIVATVLEDKGVVRPQLREATIMFTDIEGFTSICETLQPEEVVAMLNEYFAVAADPIREARGVITQFQGDAMLVSFNLPVEDPDHAANAVRAALGIQRIMQTRRFVDGITRKTRVGINTGLVVGGTVGDGDRVGYTVHGDVVNLAARLEQLNKEYGSGILISQRTLDLAGENFASKEVGRVSVRGHKEPVLVYEVAAAPASLL